MLSKLSLLCSSGCFLLIKVWVVHLCVSQSVGQEGSIGNPSFGVFPRYVLLDSPVSQHIRSEEVQTSE